VIFFGSLPQSVGKKCNMNKELNNLALRTKIFIPITKENPLLSGGKVTFLVNIKKLHIKNKRKLAKRAYSLFLDHLFYT
jgi:hypothetical protein